MFFGLTLPKNTLLRFQRWAVWLRGFVYSKFKKNWNKRGVLISLYVVLYAGDILVLGGTLLKHLPRISFWNDVRDVPTLAIYGLRPINDEAKNVV